MKTTYRETILELIKNNPGLDMSEMSRMSGICRPTIRCNIDKLRYHGKIKGCYNLKRSTKALVWFPV